jgi:hypothetical protein
MDMIKFSLLSIIGLLVAGCAQSVPEPTTPAPASTMEKPANYNALGTSGPSLANPKAPGNAEKK